MNPDFLTVDDVLAIHADQIARYGGADGVRDAGMLISAVETPRASFGGELLHNDLPQMAAAYLFHLVQNHPFVDGNKRVGTAAALIFLDINGVEMNADNDALAELVLRVARGEVHKGEVAAFFRANAGA